jgi:D-alanyl-D-alanine carboxypeptidase
MRSCFGALVLASLVAAGTPAPAAGLPSADTAKIDQAVEKALAGTGAPGASIAVVRNGAIAYVKAYGNARLEPATPARPEMRYSIGSVSKQFLAGAILLLVQDGKLSLDDSIARYLPNLTRAREITIRELLTHTSGYQDYYPLDYVAPYMLKPVTAEDILNQFARKPLDFDPGTRWQYSNTNYVAAGRIVEQAAGVPLMTFLENRIFKPLGMETPIDRASHRMAEADAAGYTRFGLGPLRPAPPEGRGWLFAAGELAMTARDLALWDISLIEHRLLKPASLEAMMTCVRLADGAPVNYGLGVGVANVHDHPRLQHGGAVSGFVSENTVWPDQGAAVVVFSNLDGSNAPSLITEQIAPLLIAEADDPHAAQALEQARQIFAGLQEGRIDRSLLTPDADTFFTAQVLADAAASLKPLAAPHGFHQTSVSLRGGMTYRHFRIEFKDKSLHLSTFTTPDGKLDQYLIQ